MVKNTRKIGRFLIVVTLAIVLFSALLFAKDAPRYMDMTSAEVDNILFKSNTYPIDDKIVYISDFFLNTPYKFDPLGEGAKSEGDKDPLFRLDKVDCLTMLEQIWGMLWAEDLAQAKQITQQMRYKNGVVAYQNRHHLSWSQWIVENENNGYVADITNKIIPNAAVLESKYYGKKTCQGKWKAFCDKLGKNMPQGKFSHYVLPLDKAMQNLDKMPHGAFLFVVLKDRPWLPYRIKHTGLLILDDKARPILRHASTHHKKVVDVALSRYLKMLQTKTKNWEVSGIILLKPQRPNTIKSLLYNPSM